MGRPPSGVDRDVARIYQVQMYLTLKQARSKSSDAVGRGLFGNKQGHGAADRKTSGFKSLDRRSGVTCTYAVFVSLRGGDLGREARVNVQVLVEYPHHVAVY